MAEAFDQLAPRLTSHDARPLRRAGIALRNFLAIRAPEVSEGSRDSTNQRDDQDMDELLARLDVLGEKTLSWKTISNQWSSADPASHRWGVVSNLKPRDFYDALKAGLNLQEARAPHDTL